MDTQNRQSDAQTKGEQAVLLEMMPSDFDLWAEVKKGRLYFTFYGELADYANGILSRFKKANKKSQAKKARAEVMRYARRCMDRLDTVVLVTETRVVIGLKTELASIVRKADEDSDAIDDSGSDTPDGERDSLRGSEADPEQVPDTVPADREVSERPAPQDGSDPASE